MNVEVSAVIGSVGVFALEPVGNSVEGLQDVNPPRERFLVSSGAGGKIGNPVFLPLVGGERKTVSLWQEGQTYEAFSSLPQGETVKPRTSSKTLVSVGV